MQRMYRVQVSSDNLKERTERASTESHGEGKYAYGGGKFESWPNQRTGLTQRSSHAQTTGIGESMNGTDELKINWDQRSNLWKSEMWYAKGDSINEFRQATRSTVQHTTFPRGWPINRNLDYRLVEQKNTRQKSGKNHLSMQTTTSQAEKQAS